MNIRKSVESITAKNVDTVAKLEQAFHRRRTFGERAADRFATAVGSWTFILVQAAILGVWVVLNLIGWWKHWDPYPFILLNLVLSFQAAFTSPIIMMSQNRQARLMDRRNQLDLQINLLAEQENTETLRLLRRLCERFDISIDEEELECMAQATKPESVLKQIEKNEGKETAGKAG